MHVLWTPSWYPTAEHPFNGTFFKDQVTILREAGHDVGVCYLRPKSFWQWRPSRTVIDASQQSVVNSFPTIPKGALPGDKSLIRTYALRMGQEYESRWGRPDVIHAHSVFPGILVAQSLADAWKVPFGITEHRPSSLRTPKNTPRFVAIKQAVEASSFRLAVSQEFAKELTKKYGTEFGVASLPVPDSFLQTRIPDKSNELIRFVHISHLGRNKRVEETIRAFAKIHGKYPNSELDIIGGTSKRIEELRHFAAERHVSESVRFLGRITRESLPTVLAQYDVLVLVSRKEAGGTVFAEAQSLGIPVIATATFGGLHMTRPSTGIVVPIDDSGALEEAMEKFTSRVANFNPKEIRAIATDRFSSETFVKKHELTYSRALESFTGDQGGKECYSPEP